MAESCQQCTMNYLFGRIFATLCFSLSGSDVGEGCSMTVQSEWTGLRCARVMLGWRGGSGRVWRCGASAESAGWRARGPAPGCPFSSFDACAVLRPSSVSFL